MYIKSKLAKSVRLALAFGAVSTAMIGGNALAQEAEAEDEEAVEKISVTGSRISNPNVESTSPVITVDSALINIRGTTDAVDLLNTLPGFFADQTTAFANGATGTSTADLRGLGANRTLILVDGKRLPAGGPLTGLTQGQDLNLIAPQLIDRVDVVTGGASAVYGSDAIAGVVNFITKKDFEGVEVDFQYGFNQHDNSSEFWRERLTATGTTPATGSTTDNDTFQLNILMGSGTDDGRGNMTAYFNYSKNNGVQQADRDFAQCATFPITTDGAPDVTCLGSNQGPFPTTFVVDGAGYSLQADDSLAEGFTNAYNFNPFNPIRRAVERFNIGFNGYYDVADDVTAYMDFGYTSSESPQVIAPSAAFGSTINQVNCDNPLLTDEQRMLICGTTDINGPYPRATIGLPSDPTNLIYGQAQVRRRFVEGGGRTDLRARSTFRSVMGLRGVIADNFDWDVFGQYAETRLQRTQFNQVTLANLQNALDIVADPVTGEPVCRVGGACVPFTSAYRNTIPSDPALVAYVDTPTLTTGTGKQTVVGGTISGDLAEYGLQLPTADEAISAVVGFEWRRDENLEQADGIASSGNLVGSGGATVPVNAETRVMEYFFEAQIPLVSGVTGIEQLNLTTAYRYSDYESENALLGNTGGEFDTDTYALGLSWVPVDDVRVRAQFQRAVRAPNVNELFNPVNSGLTSLTDPCAGAAPTATQAQCANTGLSANLYGNVPPDSGQLNVLTGGNPNLLPEESDTVTLGLVYQPHFVENLSISVDYFDIVLEGAISNVPTATTMNQCITTGNAAFCDLIQRGPDGSLTFFPREQAFIQANSQNLAEFATSGFDIQVTYQYDFGDMGDVSVDYNSTVLRSWDTQSLPGSATFDCAGFYGDGCGNPNPEYRHNMVLTWNAPYDITANLVWRYSSATDLVGQINSGFPGDPDNGGNGAVITNAELGNVGIANEIQAISYFDATVFYPLTDNVQLRAGINNLFDREPPLVTTFGQPGTGTNVEANTIAGVYDAAGRFVFFGIKANF